MRSGTISPLPPSARLIAGIASSSSPGSQTLGGDANASPSEPPWPTPTVTGNYNRRGASPASGDGLATAARHPWPTPTARDGTSGPGRGSSRQGGDNLRTALLWPTPNASLHNYAEGADSFEARRLRLLERGVNGNGAGTPLPIAVQLWRTPQGSDVKHRNGEERTPRQQIGLPNQLPASAQERLNPAWVECLMGFPVGWTLCSPDGLRREGQRNTPGSPLASPGPPGTPKHGCAPSATRSSPRSPTSSGAG